jgi:hypothetical protein
MQLVKVSNDRLLWGLSALILIAAFVVSPGFFSLDEAIYYLGARALADHGSLGLDNGYHLFHSESLRLRLLIDGPQGLTPQYPAGSALLAAPLLTLMGARAFILINAIAAVLTLFTVRKICLSQFKSETVWRTTALLLIAGSFWLEYSVGVWPHMLSTYFAVQAYWLALRHLDSKGEGQRDAILSGLFAGAGVLFRLDALLAVPAIGLILLIYARHFVRSCVLFGLGVLPSIALASWLSHLKFGSPNPLSYGQQLGGNTDLSAHFPLLAAISVAVVALLVWRKIEWRPGRRTTILSLLVLAVAMLAIPATNALLLKFWKGFMSLVMDIRMVDDHRDGIQPGPGGTVSFWNLVKKALGQSMPWIGLIAMLLTSGVAKAERRAVSTMLIFTAIMTLPFILLSWHGGAGSNMRYFLPVLPMLSMICARIIVDLWRSIPNAVVLLTAGVWAALAIGAAWIVLHPSGAIGIYQIVSTYVLLATAVAAFAAGAMWRFQQSARKLTIMLFAIGLLISIAAGLSDFQDSQIRRAGSLSLSKIVERLPPKSLIIAHPMSSATRIGVNRAFVAEREPATAPPDPKLVRDALAAGYRVFVPSDLFRGAADVPPGIVAIPTGYTYPNGQMVELRPRRWTSGAPRST